MMDRLGDYEAAVVQDSRILDYDLSPAARRGVSRDCLLDSFRLLANHS
jgi:hypothetical protein